MTQSTVPLFPLPDTILFPGQVMPLHIFEPRYRQMTRDLLDGRGELAIGTVLGDEKKNLGSLAGVESIAGLGRLEKYEELPDGRFQIILIGFDRAKILEHTSGEKEYATVTLEVLKEDHELENDTYKTSLLESLQSFGISDQLPSIVSLAQLCDLLLLNLNLPTKDCYEIFSILDLPERIERTLAQQTY